MKQILHFVKLDEDHSVLKETSNFKIIELSGGPYPTWEQIALPNAAKNMAVTYYMY
jgi:hypothetical protein